MWGELFGFEIAQLKEKIQLNREVCKGCEEVFLRLSQCKHVNALISGKARSAIECLDFLIVENMQSLGWWSDIRTGHTSPFLTLTTFPGTRFPFGRLAIVSDVALQAA